MPFGSAAAMVISGYIAHYLGWGTVFYVTGAFTVVWAGLWWWLIYETPGEHPTISDDEFNLIENSLADQGIKSAVSGDLLISCQAHFDFGLSRGLDEVKDALEGHPDECSSVGNSNYATL